MGTWEVARNMSKAELPFGKVLREKRLEKKISLRGFAELVGVSPTYLSQVEQCNVAPPTADRVKRMAELLRANPDEWTALAGRIPDDLCEIIHQSPIEIANLLRAVEGMTNEQIRRLHEYARRLKEEAG